MPNGVAIKGAMISLIISVFASTAQANEVFVPQAHGRISGDTTVAEQNKATKAAPEGKGSTNTAATGSPTNPATCNQANASSPACYSATQQTRGK